MPELRYPKVVVLAPPFYSHFRPLLALATAIRRTGAFVTVGCTEDFRDEIEHAGLQFIEVVINRNSNRGVATETDQAKSESRRLAEFLEATRRGPVETLITQARHRTADMFANPEEIIERIRQIIGTEDPSLFIVDQLSYGATLALHGFGVPYVTFCAPHPLSIPSDGAVYSVPPSWPSAVEPEAAELDRLVETARNVETEFTATFNRVLQAAFGKSGVKSAFALTSPYGVVHNYPPFPVFGDLGTRRIFAGHSYEKEALSEDWKRILEQQRPRVLIALGTFLGARADVLLTLTSIIRSARPETQLIVGAGPSVEEFADSGHDVVADRFIPQRALIPHVDVVIHHGGVSSFTESLYAGKPMIVMPFSSDQFNVARDVERYNLGAVLNPNALSTGSVLTGLRAAERAAVRSEVARWSSAIRQRGPDFAAAQLQSIGESGGEN